MKVPIANSIQSTLCGDPACHAVHILLIDEDDHPIAQATINAAMIKTWQRLLYEAAAGKDDDDRRSQKG